MTREFAHTLMGLLIDMTGAGTYIKMRDADVPLG